MISKQKKDIRSRCKRIRQEMDPQIRAQADTAIYNAVMELISEKRPKRLLTYISMPDHEVDTRAIANRAMSLSIPLAVPKCIPESSGMDFYLISSPDMLKSGYCGILEPDTGICERMTPKKGDMCLVPGFAFDRSGYRVGFGGGYYDRFSALCEKNDAEVLFVGLCYENCLFDSLPHDAYDHMVDYIITENATIPISGCPAQPFKEVLTRE